ncbi:MAG: GNAT family N-acetyltransferase [Acidimicrobiales bacterium]
MVVARPAQPSDSGRLCELSGLARRELELMRGGHVLVGSLGRALAPGAPFSQEVEEPAAHVVVGVMEGGCVVGYGTCRLRCLAGGERLGSIDELYVEAPWRRRGVGRALAKALVDWCLLQGCTGVDAPALPGDRAAKSFFEKAGFTARLLVMHTSLPAAPGQVAVAEGASASAGVAQAASPQPCLEVGP